MSQTQAAVNAAGSAFVISRTFETPRELVWTAFTEAERMRQWFSPKGFSVKSARMEFRPGGIYHYCLVSPAGQDMWGKAAYWEIAAPERLIWVNSFSDEKGGVSRHPMAPTWPLEMLTTITMAEQGGKTTITVRWEPLNPTDDEQRTFDGGHDSMRQGWTGTLDQLDEFLAKG
jgi:uncharacterized protein YndB with AHSA1/START domain